MDRWELRIPSLVYKFGFDIHGAIKPNAEIDVANLKEKTLRCYT